MSLTPLPPRPAESGTVTAAFGGGLASLRPLVRGETAPLEAVFAGMSERSRTARYLVPVGWLTGSMRRVLADVDGHDHVAWLATVDGKYAALARYVRVAPCTVELALEVVDAHQGLGLGGVMLDAVTTVAVLRGFRRFRASLLPDNRRSLRLLSELGMSVRGTGGVLEGESTLRLLDPPRVDRAAVARAALVAGAEPGMPAVVPYGGGAAHWAAEGSRDARARARRGLPRRR